MNPLRGSTTCPIHSRKSPAGVYIRSITNLKRCSEAPKDFNPWLFGANVIWKLYLARQNEQAELEFPKLSGWYPNDAGGYMLASVLLNCFFARRDDFLMPPWEVDSADGRWSGR